MARFLGVECEGGLSGTCGSNRGGSNRFGQQLARARATVAPANSNRLRSSSARATLSDQSKPRLTTENRAWKISHGFRSTRWHCMHRKLTASVAEIVSHWAPSLRPPQVDWRRDQPKPHHLSGHDRTLWPVPSQIARGRPSVRRVLRCRSGSDESLSAPRED